MTRYNLAMICQAAGDLGRAVTELEMVVELDRQVGHGDLDSHLAVLDQVRGERQLQGRDTASI
jgi:hypothetical protein